MGACEGKNSFVEASTTLFLFVGTISAYILFGFTTFTVLSICTRLFWDGLVNWYALSRTWCEHCILVFLWSSASVDIIFLSFKLPFLVVDIVVASRMLAVRKWWGIWFSDCICPLVIVTLIRHCWVATNQQARLPTGCEVSVRQNHNKMTSVKNNL